MSIYPLLTYYAVTKKIIGLITFSGRLSHTEPLFLQLNILPIDKLIQDRIGLFRYKMYNGLHPPTINNMYIKNSDVHNHTLDKNNFMSLWHIVTCMQKVFIVQGF